MSNPDLPVESDLEERRVRALVREQLVGERSAPIKIGRYTVLKPVGSGGLGVVYAAYDPDLDRKIAVKLVRPDRLGDENASEAQARLVREAQAMAKLSHHNVIHVYDVGTHEDQVFVAMEFVDGMSLREWLDSADPPWREVLEVFVQAGRGLVAAHDAGVIHRDFKPDNALVDGSGRAYVVDFGLARAAHGLGQADESKPEGSLDPRDVAGSNLATPLTQTGALVGTPAYMAPEQLRGEPTDARTDQFSFCVSLWEALYGIRPFRGRSLAELVTSVETGKAEQPADSRHTPPWLKRVVLRGLAVRREQRFPSMRALLAELERDRARTRRRVVGGTIIAVALGTTAWGVRTFEASPRCSGAEDKLAGIWDSPAKAAIENAFVEAGVPYGEASLSTVTSMLDEYVEGWSTVHKEACEATHVRGEQSGELLDRRMTCLHGRLDHVAGLIDLLSSGDPEVVERAVDATSALPTLERCSNLDVLGEDVEPPERPVRAKVDDLRRRLARARALRGAGKYEEGLEVAEATVPEARATGYCPITAEALGVLGDLLHAVGRFEEAVGGLSEAFFAADGCAHDEARFDAANRLVLVKINRERDIEAAHLWARIAGSALARSGGTADQRASLLSNWAKVLHEGELNPEAIDSYREALAIREQLHGTNHPTVATLLDEIAVVLTHVRFEYDEQLSQEERDAHVSEIVQSHERARRIREATLGADHPTVARSLWGLANLHQLLGKHARAIEYGREALQALEGTHGPNHPDLAALHTNLAINLKRRGQLDDALQHARRGLALMEIAYQPDNPNLGFAHNSVANVLFDLGAYGESLGHARQMLAVWEQAGWTISAALKVVAQAHRAMGEHDEALRLVMRALESSEKLDGPRGVRAGTDLSAVGETLLARGDHTAALRYVDRAIAIFEATSADPLYIAWARYNRARALWSLGREREHALELARAARSTYAAEGVDPTKRSEIEAWVNERSRR